MRLAEAERSFRQDKEFVGVDLPFQGDRFSLLVVTSTAKPKSLKEFAPAAGWLSGAGFTKTKGDLALPRFNLEGDADLYPALKADLKPGLDSPTALAGFVAHAKIEAILQRAKIEVNEEGAEAAAATAVIVGRSLQIDDAVHMVVDKPFLFALRDRTSGLILVAGYVGRAPKDNS
jgi:serpin B